MAVFSAADTYLVRYSAVASATPLATVSCKSLPDTGDSFIRAPVTVRGRVPAVVGEVQRE
jgi:hypothetical protein